MAVQIIVTLKCDAIFNNIKCMNDAEYETPEDEGGIIICKRCLDSMQSSPQDVSFPPKMGKKYQTDLANGAIMTYALRSYTPTFNQINNGEAQ